MLPTSPLSAPPGSCLCAQTLVARVLVWLEANSVAGASSYQVCISNEDLESSRNEFFPAVESVQKCCNKYYNKGHDLLKSGEREKFFFRKDSF